MAALRFIRRTLSLFLLALALPKIAFAITIDSFPDSDTEIKTSTLNTPVSANISTSSAIGGVRAVQVIKSGAGAVGFITVTFESGGVNHSQDFGVTGSSRYLWDGNSDGQVDVSGLGGVNLLTDGADRFILKLIGHDRAVTFRMRVYENASSASEFVVSLPAPNGSETFPMDIEFPFANFTTFSGFNGPASFSSVGAIELIIQGSVDALDVSIDSLKTNGECEHVPLNGFIYDECMVCNGDNSTCSDCLGVPNGPALPGTECDSGDFGVCKFGNYGPKPACECLTPDPGPEICDNLDNNCNAMVDEGFDLGTICKVGIGACEETGVKVCSITGGTECTAQPKSPTDEVCDGIDNDCDGEIDEITDVCGVCGGDGKSCLDCAGNPNGGAILDECGVCNGDGKTCLQCDEEDISWILFVLDAQAKEQEKLIRRHIPYLLKANPKLKRYTTKLAKTAHDLQIRNWILSWTVPRIISKCTNTVRCVEVSNVSILEEYRTHAAELRDLTLQLAKKLKAANQSGKARGLERGALRLYTGAIDLSNQVPVTTSSCD